MQIRPLTRDEVRSIDVRAAAEFGIHPLVLMENAGRGAAEWLLPRVPKGGRVLILCGPGNNGGDGGVVARHLDLAGISVAVRWFADPQQMSRDAKAQHEVLARAAIDQRTLSGPVDPQVLADDFRTADWIVDALFGTGLSRPVEGPLKTVIEAINTSTKPVLALDLPSGLDADTGQPLGVAVRATATVTFVAPQVGFSAPGAAAYTGEIHVASIGAPRRLLEAFEIRPG